MSDLITHSERIHNQTYVLRKFNYGGNNQNLPTCFINSVTFRLFYPIQYYSKNMVIKAGHIVAYTLVVVLSGHKTHLVFLLNNPYEKSSVGNNQV